MGTAQLAVYGLDQTSARIVLTNPIPAHGVDTLQADWSFEVPLVPAGERGERMGRWADSLYQVAQWYPRVAVYDDYKGWDTDPYLGSADVEESSLKVLLRDFEMPGLEAKERILRDLAAETERAYPGVTVRMEVKDNYMNMKEVLKDHPQLVENAMEAARRAGLKPFNEPIRGGTDGSRLTFRGLPCPNIFTGGFNFHGKQEFNSRRGLEKTAETLVHLVQIFAERGSGGH